jgi:hypothetical protein
LKDEFPAHLMQGDSDAGSGANVWNWQAMGVSRSLWNMVRGCLRAGLGRVAILQVIRSIQHGVPEDSGSKSEDNADNKSLEDENVQQAQQDEVIQNTSATVLDDGHKDVRLPDVLYCHADIHDRALQTRITTRGKPIVA